MTHPIPANVSSTFGETLSSSAEPGATTLSCGRQPPASVLTAVPCDVDCMEVTVSAEDSGPVTAFIPVQSGGVPRTAELDIVCGLRPLMNAGEGQTEDAKAMRLKRNPATIDVQAHYAATCGKAGHPAIRVEPAGGDLRICKSQVIAGTKAKFEAFRLPNAVERSKLWIDAGPLHGVAGLLWSFIDDDTASGVVVVSAGSCGVRASGPCVSSLATTITLHSEDELELRIKLPPLLGLSTQSSSQFKSSSGESRVDDKGNLKASKDGTTKSEESRAQILMGYEQEAKSERQGSAGAPVRSSTTTGADWNQKTVYTMGYSDGEPFAIEVDDEHSGNLNYLTQRGFELKIKHNGQELDLKGVKALLETVATILKAVNHFRALWEAGPGVKVAVGWSASWNLQFLSLNGAAAWSRKVNSGGARLVRHRDMSFSLTVVSGSASASFGIIVTIERFTLEWMAVDLSVSITLSGSVEGTLKWQAERRDHAEWSQKPLSRPMKGEIKLVAKATGKVTMLGRTIGTELAVESGLVGKAVLSTSSCTSLEQASVDLEAVVFKVSVWVGSTGEVDYVHEKQIFEERGIYAYSASA